MSKVVWSKEFEVGVEGMDAQHMKLFDYINAFEEAAANASAGNASVVALKFIEYAREHFTDEEGLMARHSYAGLVEHQQMHVAFLKKAMDGFKSLRRGDVAAAAPMLSYFKDWLITHIKTEDPKVALAVKTNPAVEPKVDPPPAPEAAAPSPEAKPAPA